jgi:hypothetical protein
LVLDDDDGGRQPADREPSVVDRRRSVASAASGGADGEWTHSRPRVATIGNELAGLSSSSAEARLRRLSWRQRRRVGPPSSSQTERPGPRRRLVRNKTFSLDRLSSCHQAEPTASAVTVSSSAAPRRRIDVWLEQLVHEGASGGRRRWSPEPRSRGRYGESLVHTLIVNHSNEHLILFVLILKLWPALLSDTLLSNRFAALNCLHLAIAYGNRRLLDYLLELALEHDQEGAAGCLEALVEQRVTGSLFRSPLDETTAKPPLPAGLFATGWRRSSKPRPAPATGFWCDQLEHWPAANGREHLILFDRIKNLKHQAGDQSASASNNNNNNNNKQIYFGQTPLAWSVAFQSKDMFEMLVSKGHARVDSRDHQGNNCLHQLIINSQQDWTRFILKFSPDLAHQFNSMQLTPFLLACHLGRVELFNELLELSAVEFWTYSSVKCCAYPLASLDPIVISSGANEACTPSPPANSLDARRRSQPRRVEAKSAVSVILESRLSSDEQKAALLSTGVIKRLLEEKWQIFAKRLFYSDLVITLLQLLLMTFACFMRPARIHSDHLQELNRTHAGQENHWSRFWSADYLIQFLQTNKTNLVSCTGL